MGSNNYLKKNNNMKNVLLVLALFIGLTATSCMEEGKVDTAKIEKTADKAKNFIDKFSTKAKDILDGEEIDKIKKVIDNVADKSKDLQQDSKLWKEKFQEIKNNEEIKKILDKHKGDSGTILKEIEAIINSLAEKK